MQQACAFDEDRCGMKRSLFEKLQHKMFGENEDENGKEETEGDNYRPHEGRERHGDKKRPQKSYEKTEDRSYSDVKNGPQRGRISVLKLSALEGVRRAIDMAFEAPIVVEIDGEDKQRILDFLSGAIYAMKGSISRVSGNVFVAAPETCNVSELGEDE